MISLYPDHPARGGGKSVLMQRMLAEYLKRNPDATVAYVSRGVWRIEKAVHGETLQPERLTIIEDEASALERNA